MMAKKHKKARKSSKKRVKRTKYGSCSAMRAQLVKVIKGLPKADKKQIIRPAFVKCGLHKRGLKKRLHAGRVARYEHREFSRFAGV